MNELNKGWDKVSIQYLIQTFRFTLLDVLTLFTIIVILLIFPAMSQVSQ